MRTKKILLVVRIIRYREKKLCSSIITIYVSNEVNSLIS